MTTPVTEAAITAAANRLMADKYASRYLGSRGYAATIAQIALTAALPELERAIRAQVLAEVEAALRDNGRWLDWAGRNVISLTASVHGSVTAAYLRATTPKENHG